MAKEKGNSPKQADKGAAPIHCQFEGCKKSVDKFGFCMEHYELYMAGVIRGNGSKPSDYEQKLARYQKSKKKVA